MMLIMNSFVSIDVETANHRRGSICQIGVVEVRRGVFTDEWSTLVNPEDDFDERNIRIHGICSEDVASAPNFADVSGVLRAKLRNRIVISHTFFDLQSVKDAKRRYGIGPIEFRDWLDSREFAYKAFDLRNGSSLKTLCRELGISFNHHNALSDARACAQIVIRACECVNFSVAEFV